MALQSPSLKNHGIGVGLRAPHLPLFYEAPLGPRPADWVEVISDNLIPGPRFFNTGARRNLLKVRKNYEVALHGVSMSLGSSTGLDPEYLRHLKALVDEVQPIAVSDHLCWTQVAGRHTHDLNPIPYTEAMLKFVSEQILRAQDFLQRRILVENVSSYLNWSNSEMREEEFLSELARRADCGLLLDLNNVFVSAANHGFDARVFLRQLPHERVGQLHLAGHTERDGILIDTHDQPVREEVWELYQWYGQGFGHPSAMIERDANIPEWDELARELDRLRAGFVRRETDISAAASAAPLGAQEVAQEMAAVETFKVHQHRWVDSLLGDYAMEAIAGDGRLDARERFKIYEEGFWSRVNAAVAVDFQEFRGEIGMDEFDQLVCDLLRERPSASYDLNELSLSLIEGLRERAHPKLAAAERDWAKTLARLARARELSADVETRFERLQEENPEYFDRIYLVLHPSLQILQGQNTLFWFDSELRQKSFSQDDWPAIVALSSRLPLSKWEGISGLTPENVRAWTQEGLICGYQKNQV